MSGTLAQNGLKPLSTVFGPVTIKMPFSMMLTGAVHRETWNQLDFSAPLKKKKKKKQLNSLPHMPILGSFKSAANKEMISKI